MPVWGGTDILGLSGKQQAAALVASTGSGSGTTPTTSSTPTQVNNGGIDPVTSPATHTSAPQTVAGGTTQPGATAQGTGNPGNVPGHPAAPGDRWQGGAPNQYGTQDPQTGRQTGGRYVDPTYQTDATGRQLTPDEQAKWRQYDVDRANASTREQAGYQAYKAAQANANKGTATNAVYNPITQTWSMVDNKGVWTNGLNSNDLQAKLDDNLKKQYPDWWWGQYANQQNLQRRYEVDAGAFDAQKFAGMGQGQGTGSTKYGPTNF